MKAMDKVRTSDLRVDPIIIWPAVVLLLAACIPSMIFPETGKAMTSAVTSWITGTFGWMYLLLAVGVFVILGWLAFGPYGHVKMGGSDAEPEFSKFTWIAMLFCCGIGCLVIYWSLMEPVYYLQGPPIGPFFGVGKEQTPNMVAFASTYGLFHWGFTGWAIYCLPTLPIGYMFFVRKNPQLRLSSAITSIIPEKHQGWIRKVIDISVVFGIMGAVCPSLGLGVPMISSAISKFIGIPESMGLNLFILVVWVILFTGSVFLGLKKGIARLSNVNLCGVLLLLAFVFFAGPTKFILNNSCDSLGVLFENIVRMSFWTDPVGKSGFPQSWTVFYWAWWVGYAPMMGLFVARISKGRTLREIIFAEVLWGTLGTWLFFFIFGNYVIHIEVFGNGFFSQVLNEQGSFAAVAAFIYNLPLGKLIMPLFIFIAFVFTATTMDSAAYVLASVTSRRLYVNDEPSRFSRLFWAAMIGLVAVTMLMVGGLKVLQASVVIMGFPMVFVLILMTMAFIKDLKNDYPIKDKQHIDSVEYNDHGTLIKVGEIR